MSDERLVMKIFDKFFKAHPQVSSLRQALLGYAEPEAPRVQLAILKLSDGKAEKLLTYIEAAKRDYRDVLAWAEYPEQIRSGKTRFNTPLSEYEALLERDRTQYEAWLDEQHSPENSTG